MCQSNLHHRNYVLDIRLSRWYVYTDMATIQKRTSRGHTYWAIVESRRVNGKPRPIVLEYLGSAETLLQRLTEGIPKKVRTYSHGTVAVMLDVARDLDVVEAINRHVREPRIRDGLTVGGSLFLAALGRICHPTSKRNWYEGWARHTSLPLILRMSLNKIDSQHFWDQMDQVPEEAIPLIEQELVASLCEKENVTLDTLLYDTTNFFSYIDTTNGRSTLAQRGKNKQKRMDLRQFGMLLLVSRQDHFPLFHALYQGNQQDRTVFKEAFPALVERLKTLCGSLEDLTVVFDQGNNSKEILHAVDRQMHFVGALSPSQHKMLLERANAAMEPVTVGDRELTCFREPVGIWGMDLTAVVYVSEKLRKGQIRGIEHGLAKVFEKLAELASAIKTTTNRGRKRTRQGLEKKIKSLVSSYDLETIVPWKLTELHGDAFALDFWVDEEKLRWFVEKWCGRRILITNRHDWSAAEIIRAYRGQADVEYAFKNLKNPFHMAFRPQYHWTDQKVRVHGLICFIAFLLTMVTCKRAREKAGFTGTPHRLIERLSAIRLATFVESPAIRSRGHYKTTYRIEEAEPDIEELAKGMGVTEHSTKTSIPFSVYI